MSDDLSSKTFLLWDYGLFPELAFRLAETGAKVKYYVHWKNAYPGSNLALIGDGFNEIERVRDFFDHVDSADCIVFPDLGDGDLQMYLRSKGKRVWGTGKAENLENFRWQTKQLQKKLGMKVQHVEKVIGVKALRKRLVNEDKIKWIKVSTFREDWETKKFPGDYDLFKPLLDDFEYRKSGVAPYVEFLVEDDIPGASEVGYDGWSIDGQWPDHAMLGWEIKGSGLIGKVLPYSDFPKEVREVNSALATWLKENGCRGNFSTELRDGILIDPCCRTPSPPGELYPDMFENYPEIVWHGAAGEVIPAKVKYEFGCEIVLESDWSQQNWTPLYFPPEIRKFVKLRNNAQFGGQMHVLPMKQGARVGAVIGLGDTLMEAIEQALKHAQMVEGHQIEADIESVGKGIKAIAQAQEEGIHVSDEPLPTEEELAVAIEKGAG